MIGWEVAAPLMGKVVGWRSFFRDFSGKRTANPERSSTIYYTSIEAALVKDVRLGCLVDISHPVRE
jgi:hypothetical protein